MWGNLGSINCPLFERRKTVEFKTQERIRFKNLLHWKGPIDKNNVEAAFKACESFLKERNISITGPIVSVASCEKSDLDENIIMYEYFIPVSEKFDTQGEFQFLEEKILHNCLICRYKGVPAGTTSSQKEIEDYIAREELKVKSTAYNVFWGMDNSSMEIIVDAIFEIDKEE